MKKLLTSLIILTMLVCAFSTVSFADDLGFTVDGTAPSGKTIAQVIQGQSSTSGVTSTIIMSKDLEIPSHNSPLTIPAGYDIVLDLNGNKLTTYRYFVVKGKLTVKNGTIDDKSGYSQYTFMGNNDGAHLVFDDATVNASATTGAITLGQDTVTTQLEIYGDTTINTLYNVIYSNTPNSKTTIYDGTFTSSNDTGRILKIQNGTANIYGGTFTNSVNPGVQESTAFGDSYNNKSIVIYGGTYSFNPNNWKASDCVVSQSGSLYAVSPKEASFTVGSKNLTTSWLGAMVAVEDNDTVTLADDATITNVLKVASVNKKFTFDIGGNTLTSNAQPTSGNSASIFWLYDSSDVTIVNGTLKTGTTTAQSAIMQGTTWGDTATTSTLTLGGDGNALKISADPATNLIASDATQGKLVVNDGVTLEIIKGSNATNNIYAMGTVEINGGIFKNNGNGSSDTGFINNLKLTNNDYDVKISGGTFNDDIEVERNFSFIEITGGKFYGVAFNDPTSGYVEYDYQSFAADGYYANEYDGYVKIENTSNAVEVADTTDATYDDGKGANTVTKRFFTMINSLDYAVVGFEITTGEYTWDIPLTNVYSKVLVNDKVYKAGADEYVLTGAIGDVPSAFDGEFEVKVYTIDFEGVKKDYVIE